MPSPRYWREIPSRYRLEAAQCQSCQAVAYPARQICPKCGSTAFEPTALSRQGTVVTSTVIHIAPGEFQMEAPYPLAIVETPEGARLMVQIADCDPEDVVPGMEVALEFRRYRKEGLSGILCYGYKGVPAH
ncbi:MAG: Zn-ribbon domain-containing OB-fold protein [Gemmatimonadota bacterium]|nr:Zn-ribbon domain-containing OB-fold protein [Gemmatimonadota bacterium]